jgi:hypothetical protein
MQISRIRLSDKTSRLHPRHVVPKPAQAHEPEVPVKVRESYYYWSDYQRDDSIPHPRVVPKCNEYGRAGTTCTVELSRVLSSNENE